MSGRTDLIDGMREFGPHQHRMFLVPRLWDEYPATTPLNWSSYPFGAGSKPLVPDLPGVYAFLIVPGIAGNLNVSYLMYVGKTDRPLRQRFAEYLLEATSDQVRPKLVTTLALYPKHCHFACAPVPAGVDPEAVEAELLAAYVPPGNDRLPAKVSRIVKAFS